MYRTCPSSSRVSEALEELVRRPLAPEARPSVTSGKVDANLPVQRGVRERLRHRLEGRLAERHEGLSHRLTGGPLRQERDEPRNHAHLVVPDGRPGQEIRACLPHRLSLLARRQRGEESDEKRPGGEARRRYAAQEVAVASFARTFARASASPHARIDRDIAVPVGKRGKQCRVPANAGIGVLGELRGVELPMERQRARCGDPRVLRSGWARRVAGEAVPVAARGGAEDLQGSVEDPSVRMAQDERGDQAVMAAAGECVHGSEHHLRLVAPEVLDEELGPREIERLRAGRVAPVGGGDRLPRS